MLNIQESVNQIKELIEDAIITGGVEGKKQSHTHTNSNLYAS